MSSESNNKLYLWGTVRSALWSAVVIELLLSVISLIIILFTGIHSRSFEAYANWSHFVADVTLSLLKQVHWAILSSEIVRIVIALGAQILFLFVPSFVMILFWKEYLKRKKSRN